MEKKTLYRARNGYTLHPFPPGQGERYYEECLLCLDPETARLTGTTRIPPREAVLSYYDRVVRDPDRFDFLITAPGGRFLGESVLNELDRQRKSANFRIAIFAPGYLGRGIGSWAAEETVAFAFRELGLGGIDAGCVLLQSPGKACV